jgi:RiboL-PSP-HEPN
MQTSLLVFKAPLVNFKASLQRVRDVADDVAASASAALRDQALRRRQETILCSVVVILSGFFESFLREVAEAYADVLAKKAVVFADLPDSVRYAHFGGGGNVLSNVGRRSVPSPYRWILSTSHDVARRLASVNNPPPYELLWEAFAETKGNPGPDVVKEFLSRFGVKKPMEVLATHVRRSHNTIHAQLDSFIAVRNECAHSGIPTSIPTPSEVSGYCDLLEAVGDGITSALSAHNI